MSEAPRHDQTRPRLFGELRARATICKTPEQFRREWGHFQHCDPVVAVYGPGNLHQPGVFLARMWFLVPMVEPTNYVVVAPTLRALRVACHPSAAVSERLPGDCPSLLEIWRIEPWR